MYALLQKLNGSLSSWEASHDQVIFESRDAGYLKRVKPVSGRIAPPSAIAFAYFPMFWRKTSARDSLLDVVSRSLNMQVHLPHILVI